MLQRQMHRQIPISVRYARLIRMSFKQGFDNGIRKPVLQRQMLKMAFHAWTLCWARQRQRLIPHNTHFAAACRARGVPLRRHGRGAVPYHSSATDEMRHRRAFALVRIRPKRCRQCVTWGLPSGIIADGCDEVCEIHTWEYSTQTPRIKYEGYSSNIVV